MSNRYKPLLDREYLKSVLHYEYLDYLNSGQDDELVTRLQGWAKRELKRETQADLREHEI